MPIINKETMSGMMRAAKALAIEKHAGQVDLAGDPYIDHVRRVATTACAVYGSLAGIVGWLHDIVEDTDVTLDHLREVGFHRVVVDAVDAITKRDGEEYDAYLTRVKANDLARMVKIVDLNDNSDYSRNARVRGSEDAKQRRLDKYAAAKERLILGA